MSRSRIQQQPQYDIITGLEAPTARSTREPLRANSQTVRSDDDNEESRKEIFRLRYEIDSLKQERDLTTLRHDDDLRLARSKAEIDYNRAQASESANHITASKFDALNCELQEIQEQAATERLKLENKARTAQDKHQSLQEELDEVQNELSSQERHFKHDIDDLQAKIQSYQRECQALQTDRDDKSNLLHTTQQRLKEKEDTIVTLETDVMQLKTASDDKDTLSVIKRELTEQLTHIANLESKNNDLNNELKKYQKHHKAVAVVEEEKRVLENKMRVIDDLRRELGEAQLQKQILEDEKSAWSSYLESEATENSEVRFNTPQDLAKAYVKEQLERASLTDQLGQIKPELLAKDEIILSLENQKRTLEQQLQTRGAGTSTETADTKARARIERQHKLAIREVNYLREQLKAFDNETIEFTPEKHDEEKTSRIKELEEIVDQYRTEVQTLHNDISSTTPTTEPGSNPLKRQCADDEADHPSSQIGSLSRKNRTLQESISQLTTAHAVLEKELSATKTQLKSFKSSSRIRVLELRSNPTANAEAAKSSTLQILRAENVALLQQLEIQTPSHAPSTRTRKASQTPDDKTTALVPHATLTRLRADMETQNTALASKDKHMSRLKQIFSAKSIEFREAVASILGWKLDFMPNGRVRVTSMFYPGEDGDDADQGESPNSIVFDGEQGTMKVSGGPQSKFAGEIKSLIDFWVEGRKEIPCFLAACTLEFWEKRSGGVTTKI